MGELRVGEVYQKSEYEDQVNEVDRVTVRCHAEVVEELRRKATRYDEKKGPDQRPVEVAAGTGQMAEVEALPDHQETAGEHGQPSYVGQDLPGTEKAEGVDEVAVDQWVERPGDDHKGHQRKCNEPENHEEV